MYCPWNAFCEMYVQELCTESFDVLVIRSTVETETLVTDCERPPFYHSILHNKMAVLRLKQWKVKQMALRRSHDRQVEK